MILHPQISKSRWRRWIAIWMIVLAGAFPSDSLAKAELEERTWTSRAGTTFAGVLQEERDDAVVLVNASGREVVVPLDELSTEDQNHLRELRRERHEAVIHFYQAGRFDGAGLPEEAEIAGLQHVVQRENFCVPASAEIYGASKTATSCPWSRSPSISRYG